MENCAFVDIFTTQNDLYGSHQCPIQFCCEIYTNAELHDDNELYNPKRRVVLNLVPDEKIMMSGFVASGISDEMVKTSDYNGYPLKDGLEKICHVLRSMIDKGVFIVGYNHIGYDLKILNEHFMRILGVDPLDFRKELLIDVMKMSEKAIPVSEIGNYTMDSVFAYLFRDVKRLSSIRTNRSTATEIRLTKMMFTELVKRSFSGNPTLSDVSRWLNSAHMVDVMNFGKYKGLSLEEVFGLDQKYLNWIRGNKDMKASNPDLVESVSDIFKEMG
jgi:hypothetical protein